MSNIPTGPQPVPRPWVKFHAHAALYASPPGGIWQSSTGASSGQWADAALAAHPEAQIIEPAPHNRYQSAPHVLFATFEDGDAGAPYVLAQYVEGDRHAWRYSDPERRDFAARLLAGAL